MLSDDVSVPRNSLHVLKPAQQINHHHLVQSTAAFCHKVYNTVRLYVFQAIDFHFMQIGPENLKHGPIKGVTLCTGPAQA